MPEFTTVPAGEVTLSPVEQVQAQLGLQKWAVDTRDAASLAGLYTADCEQVIYQGGPDGRRELAHHHSRAEIMAGITSGWARTAATWYPGAMTHQVSSPVIEPAAGGRLRCRSYATILGLDPDGAPVLKGYVSYDDVWERDEAKWRLAFRETVLYGHAPG